MECPGEDLERLNSPWLSRPAGEFPRSAARWLEVFSVCLAAAPAQAHRFSGPFFFISEVSAAAVGCMQLGQLLTLHHCPHTPCAVFHFVIRRNV